MDLVRKLLPLLIVISTGCSNEGQVNAKIQQAKVIQEHTSGFAAACKGKLSMESEYTGDVQKPVIMKMSCDDMDKKSEFFTPLNESDIKAIEKTNQENK